MKRTKEELEIEILEVELNSLKQPQWRKVSFLGIVIPAILTLLTILSGILTGYIDVKKAEFGYTNALDSLNTLKQSSRIMIDSLMYRDSINYVVIKKAELALNTSLDSLNTLKFSSRARIDSLMQNIVYRDSINDALSLEHSQVTASLESYQFRISNVEDINDKLLTYLKDSLGLSEDKLDNLKKGNSFLSSSTKTENVYLGFNLLELQKIAQKFNLKISSLLSLIQVQSSGRGFLANGKPKILFEGHIFWRELSNSGKNPENYANKNNEDILFPTWTRAHYLGGEKEYQRLERAIQIDEDAALKATSWGLFQIMGFHYAKCGFPNIQQFVIAQNDKILQLESAISYMENSNLLVFVRNNDWVSFAKGYNGPAYALNKYDVKLEQAYSKYSTDPTIN